MTKPIREIDSLSREERELLLVAFNQTYCDFPKDKCVHQLFEAQVSEKADQPAVIACDRTLTYWELNEEANRIAHGLIEKGIRPGDIVAFQLPRNSWLIAVMLGILKAGAAYVPVSADYPQERIDFILCDSGAKLFVTENMLPALTVGQPTENPGCLAAPDQLCYCIYTSGTTGNPKGVMISHRNVAAFCCNQKTNLIQSVLNCEYVLATNAVVFDITLQEIHLPLLNGKTVFLSRDSMILSAAECKAITELDGKIALITTPTKMKLMLSSETVPAVLKRCSTIMVGAEAFSPALYQRIREVTEAELFNGYGPTETTCGSCYQKVTSADITIGVPAANTQIYIVDRYMNPSPLGVIGELCIAGDGVGMGYLNRPELTAEKFIDNPFGAGKLYKTGDLAYWREDGNIAYVGRNDLQVKVRGLRIELGEIENAVSAFSGVSMAAVAEKRDSSGRQYLAAYYTEESPVDDKELRAYLAGKLPKYMIPNFFIRLDAIPMTAGGKTDRNALPMPNFAEMIREYSAPETVMEKTLCVILCRILNMDEVSVEDDFFELGGDSLAAIEYIAEAHTEGITIDLQNVFDYPTVRGLCNYLESNNHQHVTYDTERFEKYLPLLGKNCIDEAFVPKKRELGNVLLTGATGFLGSHILDELLHSGTGKVYCLVRGGQQKLNESLSYYFGSQYLDGFGERIVPITGDITDCRIWSPMPDDIKTVIHAAATVKHYGTYDYFHSVNVEGTKNIAAFAKTANARLIHISTLSVSGNSMVDALEVYRADQEKTFSERELYYGQQLDNVYIRSKFEAECAVLDAALEGLDAKIIRVGNLTNRTADMKFQPNYKSNAFLTRFRAALALSVMPEDILPLYSEFSPVDETAKGIVLAAMYSSEEQSIFHIYSNRPIYYPRLLEILHQLGIAMEVVSPEQFKSALEQTAKDSTRRFIYEAFQNDMDANGKLLYDTNIHIDGDFTQWFLSHLGFQWSEIDYAYIRGYVEYFQKQNYLLFRNSKKRKG